MSADFDRGRVDLAREADFSLGPVHVRPATRQIESGGSSETLEPRIMQVLVALARKRGQVVSRDELIETCWEGRVVGDDALNRCISKIRKLGEANDDFRLETIPRVGYRLSAMAGPAGSATSAPPTRAGERGGAPSLAVLPFANRSGLAEDEVFADGMAEDLVAAMSGGFTVRVLASGVTARFRRGAYADITAVGRELGVRYLLEGNVRRSGDNLRVTTQVVETETGEVLWSGRFDRPLTELARLQEDLVADVFTTLEVRFQTLELKRALKKPTDITAWEAVNRAYAAQRQGGQAGLSRAVEEAQRAIAIDPDYALAHATFAQAMGLVYLYASPPDGATEQLIRQHVDRALTLGSDDLFALGASSQALCCIGRPDEALTHMKRGLQQAPLVGPSHFNLGWACALLNRIEESLSSLAEADRLMPDWAFQGQIRALQANAMARAGDWKGAEAAIDEALAVLADNYSVRQLKAVACVRAGREDEARAVFGPVTTSGLPLEQVLTFTRRVYVNNSIAEEICAATRTLWAETARG